MAQSTFLDFAREHLPEPPARVLEVGCGQGELTTALAVAGYDVLGIDPLAPQGDRFRRILLEECVSRLASDDRACGAAVQEHPRAQLRAEDARLIQKPEHLARRPAVERRWLRRDHDEVGGQQSRAGDAGDSRRPIDDDMVDLASEVGKLLVKRLAGEPQHAEQSWQAFAKALLRPV